MTFRVKGKEALSYVINKVNNVNIFEKNIYDSTNKTTFNNEDELEKAYINNIYQTILDIKRNKNLSDILNNIKKGNLQFKHPELNSLLLEEKEQDNFIIKPFEIEEGVLQCKCGSRKVFSYQKQSRGGDESSSTYAECTSCKSKWVYSG